MIENLAPAARPTRDTFKGHGRPERGFFFGDDRNGPVGAGRLVTFHPTADGRAVEVRDAVTGKWVSERANAARLWIAPAAEVTAEAIAAAALDATHAEANVYAEMHRLTDGRREPSTELVLATLHCERHRAAQRGHGALALALAARIAELEAPADVVIVPCGGAKLDGPAPAGDMYVGSYHRQTRRAAAKLGGRVLILSALHGLLELDRTIARYNLRMGDPGSVTPARVREQAAALGILGARVTVLAGKAYADVVSAVWPGAVRPLDGSRGMPQQMAWLARIARGERLAEQPAPAAAAEPAPAPEPASPVDLPGACFCPVTYERRGGLYSCRCCGFHGRLADHQTWSARRHAGDDQATARRVASAARRTVRAWVRATGWTPRVGVECDQHTELPEAGQLALFAGANRWDGAQLAA